MKILTRYIFREIISSAILGTSLATFVVFIQGVGRQLFELLVRSPATPLTVVKLFVLALPAVLPLSIPFGVLVGILIGLGRLASDGEIIAIRAGGVPSRVVMPPVLLFALISTLLAGAASVWLAPRAARSSVKALNHLVAAQLTADVQARVFDEQFPNTILYVGDVRSTNTKDFTVWRNVFLADTSPPDQRKTGTKMEVDGPRITIAKEAFAIPDIPHNRIQLNLHDASVHEVGKDIVTGSHVMFPTGNQVLEAKPAQENLGKPFSRMDTTELYGVTRDTPKKAPESVESRIELYRRFSLPIACLTLGLVGIPLGVTTRKGGKSGGYIMAILLAFLVYYLAYITLTGMARQRSISPELSSWLPNAVFFLAGSIFVVRLEYAGDRDLISYARDAMDSVVRFFRNLGHSGSRTKLSAVNLQRIRLIPWSGGIFQIVDSYILTNFLFYFVLLLASFVGMTEIYNFFELLSFIVKNSIPLTKVFSYLFFLGPKLIYDMLPISVLVSVLVTFSILTKQNEITAFKASGVSVHRLSVPILMMSAVLSVALFAFDYYYIPAANLRQDALRAEIKGQPVQTYLRPDLKYIFGQDAAHPRIFYYKYFESAEKAMVGVNVYELQRANFQLTREIGAERARWDPSLGTWVFTNGWSRDIDGVLEHNVRRFQATTFPELSEHPDYFMKEVKLDKQMNFHQLADYIRDLQQSGFDTVKLQVQYHKKFAVPVFALIMAMLSIPFGFLIGNRGAMAGIGFSVVIAMAYWGLSQFFEQLGNVTLLPAVVAAWAPDALFALFGTYFLLRMRS
jgi:LPS export ABC transporter permease LptG/LPS export ABC transporter permease LptF